jgi:ADP-ribose pyrophosphatase
MAEGLTPGATNLDTDEFIEVEKIPFKRAYDMIFDGTIIDGKSIIGIQYAFNKMGSK